MGNKSEQGSQPELEKKQESFQAGEVSNSSNPSGSSRIDDITDESSHRDADGILRQTLRGDETKGDPDDRDVAGATKFEDTPHGREETKNDKTGAANQNG